MLCIWLRKSAIFHQLLILMKAAQTEPMQVNHQFTPDTIGFLITFLYWSAGSRRGSWRIRNSGSGTGNLAETVLNHTQKKIDYLGSELDDYTDLLPAQSWQPKAHFCSGWCGSALRFWKRAISYQHLPGWLLSRRQYRLPDMKWRLSGWAHTYAHHLLWYNSCQISEARWLCYTGAKWSLDQRLPLLKNGSSPRPAYCEITLPESIFKQQAC